MHLRAEQILPDLSRDASSTFVSCIRCLVYANLHVLSDESLKLKTTIVCNKLCYISDDHETKRADVAVKNV